MTPHDDRLRELARGYIHNLESRRLMLSSNELAGRFADEASYHRAQWTIDKLREIYEL